MKACVIVNINFSHILSVIHCNPIISVLNVLPHNIHSIALIAYRFISLNRTIFQFKLSDSIRKKYKIPSYFCLFRVFVIKKSNTAVPCRICFINSVCSGIEYYRLCVCIIIVNAARKKQDCHNNRCFFLFNNIFLPKRNKTSLFSYRKVKRTFVKFTLVRYTGISAKAVKILTACL